MLTLYVPTDSSTDARGYWKDKAGKTHQDNISFVDVEGWIEAGKGAQHLFTEGEECVAIEDKETNTLYLLYPNTPSDILHKRIESKDTKQNRERHLDAYGGFTCSGGFIYSYR